MLVSRQRKINKNSSLSSLPPSSNSIQPAAAKKAAAPAKARSLAEKKAAVRSISVHFEK